MSKADSPKTKDQKFYHTHTRPGDVHPLCLIVGAPGRARMIGKRYLKNVKWFFNTKRGLVTCSGKYKGVPVSVTTSGMGGASTGIILPEIVASGARILIRVGSCGSLVPKSKPGDVIVVRSAFRFDGASENWAGPEVVAKAHPNVSWALNVNAENYAVDHFAGAEATTSDFYEGQGRPNLLFGTISKDNRDRHEMVMNSGARCYSMEAATLFVWCATQGGGLPCGAINAVYANRHTNEFEATGDETAARIALEALRTLAASPSMRNYLSRKLPIYPGLQKS